MSSEAIRLQSEQYVEVVGIKLAREQVVGQPVPIEGTTLTPEEIAAAERRRQDEKAIAAMLQQVNTFDSDNAQIAQGATTMAEKLAEAAIGYEERGKLARERAAEVTTTFQQARLALEAAEAQASASTAEKTAAIASHHESIGESIEPFDRLIDKITSLKQVRMSTDQDPQHVHAELRQFLALELERLTEEGAYPGGLLGKLMAEVASYQALVDITGTNEIDLEEKEQREINYHAAKADVDALTETMITEKTRSVMAEKVLNKAGNTLHAKHLRSDEGTMLSRILERIAQKSWRRGVGGVALQGSNVLEPKPAVGTTPKEKEITA